MARKKAAAAAADPVDISVVVEQWFTDAHRVVNLCRHVVRALRLKGHFVGFHPKDLAEELTGKPLPIVEVENADQKKEYLVTVLGFDDHIAAKMADANSKLKAHEVAEYSNVAASKQARKVIAEQLLHYAEQLRAELGSLDRRLLQIDPLTQKEQPLPRLFQLAYSAIGQDFNYGRYSGGLFAWTVLQPFGDDLRLWLLDLREFWDDFHRYERSEQYYRKLDQCPWEAGICTALIQRLTLECEHVIRTLKSKPKNTRSKKKDHQLFENGQLAIVYQFLKLWHRYEKQDKKGNDEFRHRPVGVRELEKFAIEECKADQVTPPSYATISRFFQDQFGSHYDYAVSCNNELIKSYFVLREGHVRSVFQGNQPPRERSVEDPTKLWDKLLDADRSPNHPDED